MDRQELREALGKPYVGIRDPDRPPELITQWTPIGRVKTLRVWNYEDVRRVMAESWASRRFMPNWVPLKYLNLGLSGPPTQERGSKHDHLRATAESVVSPAAFRSRREEIQQLAYTLVTEAGTEFDLADLADRFTYQVICLLLGVDESLRTEAQQRQFASWLDGYGESTSVLRVPLQSEIKDFYRDYIGSRRRLPESGRQPIDTLLDSKELSEHEKIAALFFIMLSGTITTAYAACSAYALMQTELEPEQIDPMRQSIHDGTEESDGRQLDRLYEEGLRFHPPVISRPLRVIEPVEFAGYRLRKGNLVEICWPSANRDWREFDNPHTFDPGRRENRKHLSFSFGDYGCPGRGLSGFVATALLRALLAQEQLPVVDHVETKRGVILRMGRMQVTTPNVQSTPAPALSKGS